MRCIPLLFALLFFVACGGDTDVNGDNYADSTDTYQPSDFGPAPAPAEPPPLRADEKEIKVNTQELKARSQSSTVADENCCSDVTNLQPCCCDKVTKKYEEFLAANDLDGAMALDGKDVYYKLCLNQFPAFEDKIIALQDKYLD